LYKSRDCVVFAFTIALIYCFPRWMVGRCAPPPRLLRRRITG
jgi:hypothetical protein